MTLGLLLRPQWHPSSCRSSTGTRPRCSPRPVVRATLCNVVLFLGAWWSNRRRPTQQLCAGRPVALLLVAAPVGWVTIIIGHHHHHQRHHHHHHHYIHVCISCQALLHEAIAIIHLHDLTFFWHNFTQLLYNTFTKFDKTLHNSTEL